MHIYIYEYIYIYTHTHGVKHGTITHMYVHIYTYRYIFIHTDAYIYKYIPTHVSAEQSVVDVNESCHNQISHVTHTNESFYNYESATYAWQHPI